MKKLLYILLFIFISDHAFSQDTTPDARTFFRVTPETQALKGRIQFITGTEDKSSQILFHTERHKKFALKTNLLYYGVLTPNIEAELYIAPRWSIAVEYIGAWWQQTDRHRYWRIWSPSLEARYWIKRKDYFHGQFIGAYVSGGEYEFMLRPSHGVQGEVYATGGFTYGYAFHIGRSLGMELSLGVGYVNTKYRQYHWNGECYQYDATKRQEYIGITKAKVSLIWRM